LIFDDGFRKAVPVISVAFDKDICMFDHKISMILANFNFLLERNFYFLELVFNKFFYGCFTFESSVAIPRTETSFASINYALGDRYLSLAISA